SWSQLLPGNTMTPNFMVRLSGELQFSLTGKQECPPTKSVRNRPPRGGCGTGRGTENDGLAGAWTCSGVAGGRRMGSAIRVIVALALTAVLGMASGEEKFAGTWEASAKGHVFLVLKVKAAEKISGTLNAGHIEIDDEGELKEAGPVEDHEAPIFFA